MENTEANDNDGLTLLEQMLAEVDPSGSSDASGNDEKDEVVGVGVALAEPAQNDEEECVGLAVPAEAQPVTDWDTAMTTFCRELSWGHFSFHWKRTHPIQRPHGSIEMVCPYHRLNDKSVCKKVLSLSNRSIHERDLVARTLKHWGNGAKNYNRQRLHILPFRLDTSLTPSEEVVNLQKLTDAPPERVLSDIALDTQELQGSYGRTTFVLPS